MAWQLLVAGWMSLTGSAEELQAPELGKSQPLSQDGARVTVPEQMCLSSVFMQFCSAHKAESSLLTPNGKRNIDVLDRCMKFSSSGRPSTSVFSPKSGRSQGKGPVFPSGGTLTSKTAASLLPGLCDQKVICYELQRKVGGGIDGSQGPWWGVTLVGLPVPGDGEDVEEQRRSHDVLFSL